MYGIIERHVFHTLVVRCLLRQLGMLSVRSSILARCHLEVLLFAVLQYTLLCLPTVA